MEAKFMQLAPGGFNFCIVFSLLSTSETMSKKGNIWCIWGLRCGNGEERERGQTFIILGCRLIISQYSIK